jgi:hypothetical protein
MLPSPTEVVEPILRRSTHAANALSGGLPMVVTMSVTLAIVMEASGLQERYGIFSAMLLER